MKRSESLSFALCLTLLLFEVLFLALGCTSSRKPEVVVYVSEDQVFSEPILKDFERETGIAVRAVFDTEEAKSTGVMNRLLAEKENPQADLYWANEPIRAELLKQRGISAPYDSPSAEGIPAAFQDPDHHWTGFSARARVLIVNDRVARKPNSVQAYVDPAFEGRTAIANPLFGTTTAYAAALFSLWGEERTKALFEGMKMNRVKITGSNGESADLVAAGECDFALVDSDDAFNRKKQGKLVSMIVPDQGEREAGVLLLPNAALIIKGGPHPENARKLIDYLLSKETERKLAFADCAQIPLHAGVQAPSHVPRIDALKLMPVHIAEVARKMEAIQPYLKSWTGY
jgi:iron(III) transport system substrate-binding protein